MEASERALVARARRAYEWGRLRRALRVSASIGPLVLVSLLVCAVPGKTLAIGALLLLAASGMLWRGGIYAEAVGPGIAAGLGALAAPLLATMLAALAGSPPDSILAVAYFAGGAVTGGAVGIRAFGAERQQGRFLLSAALVAGLTGSLGCVMGGAGGIVGMALGLVAATTPVFVLVRARA